MNTSIKDYIADHSNILATFVASFAGVVLALPFAAALISNNSSPVAAHAQPATKTATADPNTCPASSTTTSGGATSSKGSKIGHSAIHRSFHAYPAHSSSSTTTTTNNTGANSQIGNSVVGVSTAINDFIDVGDVNTNVLSYNNIPVLSNNDDVLSDNNILSNNLSKNTVDVDLASIIGL